MEDCIICCALVLITLILIYISTSRKPTKNIYDFILVVAIICQLYCCKESWDYSTKSILDEVKDVGTSAINLLPGVQLEGSKPTGIEGVYHY